MQGFPNHAIPQPLTLAKQMCSVWSKCGEDTLWAADNWAMEMGRCGSCCSKVSRMLVRWERGPPALPWHACPLAFLPAVCQLCPFPDLTFGEILRSCLNHFLSRPHFQFWELGPEPQPRAFSHLAVGHLSSIVLSGTGICFLGSR